MPGSSSPRPPLVWHPEWPALAGWVLVAAFVCLLYSWLEARALPVLLALLTVCAGVGTYLSSGSVPHWHVAGQQRQLWADLASISQGWTMLVLFVVRPVLTSPAATAILPWQRQLLYRHLAWLHAVRLHRAGAPGHEPAQVLAYLEPAEAVQLQQTGNLPAQLLACQVAGLHQLHREGRLTDAQLMSLLSCLERLQALPEAVPLSKPPKTWRWVSWTWLHAALLTALLVSVLVETAACSLWLAVPLTGLICWVVAVRTAPAPTAQVPAFDYSRKHSPAAVCHAFESELSKMPVVALSPEPATH